MADPRFYKKKGPFTLAKLSEFGQCELHRGDSELLIQDVAPLDDAQALTIGVFHNIKYAELLSTTKASAIILAPDMLALAPIGAALLVSKYPYRSYALIANAFYPKEIKKGEIDPTASVHPTAKLGQGVIIGPMAVIGANAEIGDNVEIGPLSVIGESVTIDE